MASDGEGRDHSSRRCTGAEAQSLQVHGVRGEGGCGVQQATSRAPLLPPAHPEAHGPVHLCRRYFLRLSGPTLQGG